MYDALLAHALLAGTTYAALAFTLLRSKRVGGLRFCKLGRFGFCFYFSKPTPARTVTNTITTGSGRITAND